MKPPQICIFFFKILHDFISSKIDSSLDNIITRCKFLMV
jgi:hypothetical protein